MEKIDEKVIATLVGSAWALECSKCGPLGVASESVVDSLSSAHLQTHTVA